LTNLRIAALSTMTQCSTFDEYSSEIESGHLSWTPPHRSEEFWHENAPKLIEQNNRLLKVITQLLTTSKDPLVLAVVCHDIGQLVKQVSQARM
jgi:V-type H+-transporting ATPase subunit H